MRSIALLLCLPLAACAAGGFPGGTFPIAGPAPEKPAPAAASPPPSGGARGGATTAAARAAAEDPDAPSPTDDPVIQARADCWMKVESQRALKGIDQRIAYVDKCVANELRNGPRP